MNSMIGLSHHHTYTDPVNSKIQSLLYNQRKLNDLYLGSKPMNKIISADGNLGAVYLGNIEAANNGAYLQQHGIEAVLTVANDTGIRYRTQDIPYHQTIQVDDVPWVDLAVHFEQIYRFIEKARQRTNVLVHCYAGVSRSATSVIMYMMRKYGYSFDQSFSICRRKRKVTNPNPGFIKQLLKYEQQLNGRSDTTSNLQPVNLQKSVSYPHNYQSAKLNRQVSSQPFRPATAAQNLRTSQAIGAYYTNASPKYTPPMNQKYQMPQKLYNSTNRGSAAATTPQFFGGIQQSRYMQQPNYMQQSRAFQPAPIQSSNPYTYQPIRYI